MSKSALTVVSMVVLVVWALIVLGFYNQWVNTGVPPILAALFSAGLLGVPLYVEVRFVIGIPIPL